jgi:hypothetical protein
MARLGYWICANGVAHTGACNCVTRPPAVDHTLAVTIADHQRPAVIDGAVVAAAPNVVEGEVVRVIEIEPYPQAFSALGGCTSFTGRYVTDSTEIAAIRRRVGGAR